MIDKEYRRPEDCIGDMLRAIYGDVRQHEKIYLGTKPDDYLGKPFHSDLSLIYSALENHRDFRDFVQAQYVTPDFYIPNPGFVVECDESQHFTKPRKISLENYPNDKKVGFLKQQWIARCEELDKHDNDPPSRDEKRAWYDTLRDFLPEIKGFLPTVRLYYKEMDWCRLDPNNATDQESFKKIISEKQSHAALEVIIDSNPKFARVIICGPWEGNPTRAKSLMGDIIDKWPNQDRVTFFVTPGAFLRFPWPEHFPIQEDNLHPSNESLNLLRDAARKQCNLFLDENLRHALAEHADYLTIGIDSTDERQKNGYQVEFVALVDLKTNQYFWTGKSYPDSPQEHRLIRLTDLSSHFIQLPLGKVLVLGCHDLKMFSNRGRTSAGKVQGNTWRKMVHQEIDQLVAREKPIIILQHPHTTDRYGSWYAEWNELTSHCPSDVSYISSGLYHYYGKPCRSSLTDVRNFTRRGASLDFILPLNAASVCCNQMRRDLRSFSENADMIKKPSPQKNPQIHPKWREIFKNIILAFYRGDIDTRIRTSYKGESQFRLSVAGWPKVDGSPTHSICYEFDDWKGRMIPGTTVSSDISVEIQFWNKDFAAIGKIIEKNKAHIAGKLGGDPHVVWDTKIDPRWSRLQFFYSASEDPELIARSMHILIRETQGLVNNWLAEKGLAHY